MNNNSRAAGFAGSSSSFDQKSCDLLGNRCDRDDHRAAVSAGESSRSASEGTGVVRHVRQCCSAARRQALSISVFYRHFRRISLARPATSISSHHLTLVGYVDIGCPNGASATTLQPGSSGLSMRVFVADILQKRTLKRPSVAYRDNLSVISSLSYS